MKIIKVSCYLVNCEKHCAHWEHSSANKSTQATYSTWTGLWASFEKCHLVLIQNDQGSKKGGTTCNRSVQVAQECSVVIGITSIYIYIWNILSQYMPNVCQRYVQPGHFNSQVIKFTNFFEKFLSRTF